MQKSGGKKAVVFRQISPYTSIIQPFPTLISRFENRLNKALRKSWMLGCVNNSLNNTFNSFFAFCTLQAM